MKDHPPKQERERALHVELSELVAKVKGTIDKEEAALDRIREVLRELEALQREPPDESSGDGASI
jgi:hypothetical protein